MQDGNTRQQRAVVTRAAIIEAAAAEFDERGYLGASVDAVAERAGLTKGAVYFHFASKAELAGAVIARQHEVARGYAEDATARGTTPLESMMWMAQGLATQMIHEVVVSAGIRLSTDSASVDVDRQNPYEDWIVIATATMQRAIEAGEVDPSWDPALIARVVIPAYTGVQTMSDVLANRSDLYERLRELWTVLLAAIVTARMRPEIPRLVAIIGPGAARLPQVPRESDTGRERDAGAQRDTGRASDMGAP
ncbi:ScbR family autoregulator-binding transcription factor [Curtobacterium sp. ISL-83]|uniref:ScbR family autoregulator-binding transcription factor n=1 Tax=Curtobacterium sp. ISL-83 TaxID=2819145 RepID=UPI001BE852DC|nr:ScbR family autoregulator-binding transcription factor [Curtobacterium sp. ISL-83]MBT2502080.1 TetR/AcrR family transcriptional regulator [Curtobacterium sp. ISL-83]